MISKQIEYYARAGYPALYISTHEEQRVCREIHAGLKDIEIVIDGETSARKIYSWSCTQGLSRVDSAEDGDPEMDDPFDVLQLFINGAENGSTFVLQDFHLYLEDPAPQLIRLLKDALEHGKTSSKMLVIVGCRFVMPPEVEKLITVVDFKLPVAEELAEVVLDPLAEDLGLELTAEERKQLSEAGGGLTTFEFQDALALSYVQTKNETGELKFCTKVVYDAKVQAIKKSGLLEVITGDVDASQVGGLDLFKDAMSKQTNLFTQEARDFGVPLPKGVLVVGPPGCGKSLLAKVSKSMLGGIPLLGCDMGKMFAGVVGASEENVRNMIDLVEAVAPCILFIDEIERGLSGGESSGKTDGGTTDRMIGTLLNWMQERTSPVFIFATANDTSSLPAQLLRPGRLDSKWFIDLPNANEREEIWNIMIRRSGHDPKDCNIPELSASTDGWSGAEIEALWNNSLVDAFASDKPKTPHTLDVVRLSSTITPVSKSAAQKITGMRKWAAAEARPATSKMKKEKAATKSGRSLN
jgi:SpoVK/Ycf46/Vps4 family AAA+-type ATPase